MFESIDTMTLPERYKFNRDFPKVRFFSSGQSFIWWWWMFMFKEDGVRKQIVAFWTAKTYPDNEVNGVKWGPAHELKGTPDHFTYKGMTTWWFWDGKRFHETNPSVAEFTTIMRDGKVEIRGDDVELISDDERFDLRFCRDPEEFDLRIESVIPTPPPVSYKRTMLTKKIGFDALKIYHSDFTGSLSTEGRERGVNGSLYMQNITLNTPALPWFWGVFHKDDGTYLTYFASFLGPQMFARTSDCSPWMDRTVKLLNKNLNYTRKGEETMKFKKTKFRVTRDKNGYPITEISGTLGEERLRIKVRTLGKTTYRFERRKYWRNTFFYNEFPSEIVEFEHIDTDGKVNTEDCEHWTGNCEYSFGVLLN